MLGFPGVVIRLHRGRQQEPLRPDLRDPSLFTPPSHLRVPSSLAAALTRACKSSPASSPAAGPSESAISDQMLSELAHLERADLLRRVQMLQASEFVLLGCLAVTAWGLWKQRQIVVPVSIITSVLLLCDAWVDL